MDSKKKKIIVLGGGTVGWLTALLVRKHYPTYNVVLIENSEIGVLGAGEGTTPSIFDVFETIDVPVADLIKHCKATIKIGNKFIDWSGDEKEYFLPFGTESEFLNYYTWVGGTFFPMPFLTHCIATEDSIDNIMLTSQLAKVNKLPLIKTLESKDEIKFEKLANYALHLDARALAVYLKELSLKRNITRIDGNYISAKQDDNGNITGINLEDGSHISCDFIFDCSGFARLLVGKLHQTRWISYEKYFPQNTAVPFFIPHDNKNLKSYTQSRGMKYGWMWSVETQDRSGNGYVFDSTLITPEQALQEVEELLGHPVTSPKTFKFNAGVYETSIVKNCMAVGLSSGFIEPLEATAIWQNIKMIGDFLYHDGVNNFNNSSFLKSFQVGYERMNTEILEFIQGHYITPRADTEFWKKIRYDTPLLPSLEEKIECLKSYDILGIKNRDKHVGVETWTTMALGQQILDLEKIKQITQVKVRHPDFDKLYDTLKSNVKKATEMCISHDEFLKIMKEM